MPGASANHRTLCRRSVSAKSKGRAGRAQISPGKRVPISRTVLRAESKSFPCAETGLRTTVAGQRTRPIAPLPGDVREAATNEASCPKVTKCSVQGRSRAPLFPVRKIWWGAVGSAVYGVRQCTRLAKLKLGGIERKLLETRHETSLAWIRQFQPRTLCLKMKRNLTAGPYCKDWLAANDRAPML